MEEMENVMTQTSMNLDVAITIVQVAGFVIGIILMFLLSQTKGKISGSMGKVIDYLQYGVLLFTLAFLVSIAGPSFSITMPYIMLSHMALMVTAMIMIVFAGIAFTSLFKK